MDKKLAKKFLFRVADIIESHNLPFFLSDGTCLGAYREKDFIEWDTDIDIKMMAEELIPNIAILSNEFIREGYRVCPVKMGSILHEIVLWSGGINLDLYGFFLINKRRWQLCGRDKVTLPAELFEKLEQIEFLGRKFYVPSPIEKYLECLYGQDYMTPKKASGRGLVGLRAKGMYGQLKETDIPKYKIKIP